MGHLEYASPECSNLVDLVTYDRAGDMIIQDALDELGWTDQVSFIKNNVDLENNSTFGCHENYLVSRSLKFDNRENLVAASPAFRLFIRDSMAKDLGVVAYHPGAIRFYKEQYLWPPAN